MTDLQTLQITVNDVTKIANQVQQIAHQVQNLQSFPAALSGQILGQYVQQYGQLVQGISQINGMATNVAGLLQRYNQTYPNMPINGGAGGPLTTPQVMAQLAAFLNTSRAASIGAYNTQAQVMTSLGADSSTIQRILTQSGASSGNLDAIQAQTQLTGQVASQLLKMNQQMASMNQAQMTIMAQQTQEIAKTQQLQVQAMGGYGLPSTTPVLVGAPVVR